MMSVLHSAFIQQHAVEYETDITRIALLGRSAGGHLAMLAAYQPDALPVRAVVSYYGPFNLTKGYTRATQPRSATMSVQYWKPF
jgi:acetyl esterase/lipase